MGLAPSRNARPLTAVGDPLVRLDDVALTRGGRRVLHAVSLAAPAGAVTALVGPSGAGKSSVLRCVVGLDALTAGRVRIEGRDARELAPRTLRRRVALVTQHPVMLPGTVAENLAYALTADAAGPDAQASALRRAGLAPDVGARVAGELSGGERARVAVARALMREPVALLLDEPTAALDPQRAAGLEALARELAGRGLAVLVASHDLALVRRSADVAVLLVAGRTVAAGDPALVLQTWEERAPWR
jgi:ABC-type multidrug transport system fused ATPase/permease subunit